MAADVTTLGKSTASSCVAFAGATAAACGAGAKPRGV